MIFFNVNAQMSNKRTNIIFLYDIITREFKIKEKVFFFTTWFKILINDYLLKDFDCIDFSFETASFICFLWSKKTGWKNKTSFKDKIILLPGTCTSSYELTQEDVLVLHFSIY